MITNENVTTNTMTLDSPDPLELALRKLAREFDDHADRVARASDDVVSAEPIARAAAQLRLVAVLFADGVYDRVTTYVWLQAGRRLLVNLGEAWEISR